MDDKKMNEILKPYAEKLADIYQEIRQEKYYKRKQILEAMQNVSQGNCWWITYRLAKTFEDDVRLSLEYEDENPELYQKITNKD